MNSAGSSSVSSMGSPVSRQTILGNSSGMINGNVNQRNRQMMMVDGSSFQPNNNGINMSMGNMSGHGTSHSGKIFHLNTQTGFKSQNTNSSLAGQIKKSIRKYYFNEHYNNLFSLSSK